MIVLCYCSAFLSLQTLDYMSDLTCLLSRLQCYLEYRIWYMHCHCHWCWGSWMLAVFLHSGYDFGYMLKILTSQPLPTDESEFFDLVKMFFPNIYDVKYLMKSCKNLKGGLQEVADQLEVNVLVFTEVKERLCSVCISWWEPITELQSATCNMGPHSVTCHPRQVNVFHVNRSQTIH